MDSEVVTLEDIKHSGVKGMKWDEAKKKHKAEIQKLAAKYGISTKQAESLKKVIDSKHLSPSQIRKLVDYAKGKTSQSKKKPELKSKPKSKPKHKNSLGDIIEKLRPKTQQEKLDNAVNNAFKEVKKRKKTDIVIDETKGLPNSIKKKMDVKQTNKSKPPVKKSKKKQSLVDKVMTGMFGKAGDGKWKVVDLNNTDHLGNMKRDKKAEALFKSEAKKKAKKKADKANFDAKVKKGMSKVDQQLYDQMRAAGFKPMKSEPDNPYAKTTVQSFNMDTPEGRKAYDKAFAKMKANFDKGKAKNKKERGKAVKAMAAYKKLHGIKTKNNKSN